MAVCCCSPGAFPAIQPTHPRSSSQPSSSHSFSSLFGIRENVPGIKFITPCLGSISFLIKKIAPLVMDSQIFISESWKEFFFISLYLKSDFFFFFFLLKSRFLDKVLVVPDNCIFDISII